MAKTLLRSGDLDDFQAVGGGGQAVFDSALQIREALRLRKQQALVDCLAIPQVNDEGDRVDWYSPVDGRSVSWKAADEEARFRALRYLESTMDSAFALSRKCMQSPKTAQQLFGSLLEKALQFPGENHVFLVDGKPVITFWGFVNLNESARENVLDCLRHEEVEPIDELPPEPESEPEPEPEPEPEEEPAAEVTFTHADEPLLAPPRVITPAPAPAVSAPTIAAAYADAQPADAPATKKRRRYGLWAIPVAVAIAAAIGAPLLLNHQPQTSAPPQVAAPAPTPAPATVAIAPEPVKTAPEMTAVLPLHPADVNPAVVKEEEQQAPIVIAAIAKDAMVMDVTQMKLGQTRFLNGDWRLVMEIKDPVTGTAPSVRYQIKDNKGTARIVHGKNVTCRAELFSGLHQTGELMIKSRGNARCSDGTRYPMPEISCKAGTNNVAECSARFDAKTTVPVTFSKTGD